MGMLGNIVITWFLHCLRNWNKIWEGSASLYNSNKSEGLYILVVLVWDEKKF